MSRIRPLPPVVADQIAAGEVVERPASVVKELMENAFDAGASHVRVALETRVPLAVTVDDDGVGMDREDVELAVGRHCTSKIQSLDDLAELTTLGFRGEALAAIAAVSRLTLESRERGSDLGWRLVMAHGRRVELTPVGRAPGTTVRVEDLFLTVPARLKALKSPAAELQAARHWALLLALSRPDVAVSLVVDGRADVETRGDGDGRQALAAVYGLAVAERVLPVEGAALGGDIRVRGWIAPPDLARGNRQGQVLTVNGRVIGNWALRAAVESAFEPLLPERRYPLFWLAVTVLPADVDPNAHPTKAEVRLQHERAVAGLLRASVAEALRGAPASPLPVLSPASRDTGWDQPAWGWVGAAEDEAPHPALHADIAALVPLGQWGLRYLVAQSGDQLFVIDQHAAQERVFYDALVAEADAVTWTQPLLVPIAATLTPAEWAAWHEHREALLAAGFRWDSPGGTTIALHQVPALLADEGGASLVGHLLQSLAAQDWAAEHPVSWAQDHRLATAACKAAIKANRPLERLEMQHLLRALAATPSPRACPHGRPVALMLTLKEVDRYFGRH
jgi:DNA mismatch repair protein MutL